jgi:ABC-type phosphate transport system substrate-binding protein
MRRNLAAVAVLGTLLGIAGCSSGTAASTDAPGPASSAGAASAAGATGTVTTAPVDPAVAASADAALSGNTKAICAQAARTSTTFGQAFIADLRLQIDAAGKGAEAKTQAEQKITRDVQNYSYALADMAKLTTDPALKTALTQMSKQVTALKGDLTKINADKMSALTATLDGACGKR